MRKFYILIFLVLYIFYFVNTKKNYTINNLKESKNIKDKNIIIYSGKLDKNGLLLMIIVEFSNQNMELENKITNKTAKAQGINKAILLDISKAFDNVKRHKLKQQISTFSKGSKDLRKLFI